MQFIVLGSSSAGNGYILIDNKGQSLLLEAGIGLKHILRHLRFDISKIQGLLVSHSHLDHCRYAFSIASMGINIYCNQETYDKLRINNGINTHRLNMIDNHQKLSLGNFEVQAFSVSHDIDCLGFKIDHKESGRIVFVTDSNYIPALFERVNYFLVECNFSSEIIEERINNNPNFYFNKRTINTHLEINTLRDYFKIADMTRVEGIIMLHLSDLNSNAAKFKKEIMEATGCPVHIAEKGKKFNLDINNK